MKITSPLQLDHVGIPYFGGFTDLTAYERGAGLISAHICDALMLCAEVEDFGAPHIDEIRTAVRYQLDLIFNAVDEYCRPEMVGRLFKEDNRKSAQSIKSILRVSNQLCRTADLRLSEVKAVGVERIKDFVSAGYLLLYRLATVMGDSVRKLTPEGKPFCNGLRDKNFLLSVESFIDSFENLYR